jgi:hypothetical protein
MPSSIAAEDRTLSDSNTSHFSILEPARANTTGGTLTAAHSLVLNTDQQQQIVYASLMRFGNETISLRQRCLDHLVMNGLLGASVHDPMKVGQLQKKLHLGTHAPILRSEVLRDALLRLDQEGKVHSVLIRKKKCYFLSIEGKKEIGSAVVSAESLYKPVIERLLAHTEDIVAKDIAVKICTDFICEAFARCGLALAKDVHGHTAFPHPSDLAAAFHAAAKGMDISETAKQTLESRCLSLFKSRELDVKRLIFYLTQGYYFVQLLGLDHNGFDPIAEQAFQGSVFYLDTNVILHGLLPNDGGRAFGEMINVSKRMGINLRITRASINEARRVGADRLTELKQIQGKVPAELAEKSLDDFIVHFYEQRRLDPTLTPEDYLAGFDRLTDTVRDWGIEIDDLTEQEMLNGRVFADLENRIQTLSAKYRKGRTKSEGVLKHDVAHYALVQDRRHTNGKTWFLTRDRSLVSCAEDVCGADKPFCFGLIGFLQSISPFVVSDIEGNSLSAVFAELLKEQLITTERLFDSRELVLLAEMHSDVLSSDSSNLLPAIDFVKFSVLQGKAYRSEDFPRVSLELRKFLASSKDEQKKVLEDLNARLRSEADAERQAAVESRQAQLDAESALLEKQSELDEQSEKLESSQAEILGLHAELDKRLVHARLTKAVGGVAGGALLWVFGPSLSAVIQKLMGTQRIDDAVVQTLATSLFCLPALQFLRKSEWRPEVRLALGSIVLLAALWIVKVISPSVAADVGSYLAIAAVLASVLLFPKWKD